MREDILKQKTKILFWIAENKSKAFICDQLNCKPDTLNFWLNKMNISYVGNMAGVGMLKSKVNLEDIITNKVKFDAQQLKKRLIYEDILKNECNECNNTGEWNGKPLILELDHINGDSDDNRLKNLRILCPNCHSQTPTFRRKKK